MAFPVAQLNEVTVVVTSVHHSIAGKSTLAVHNSNTGKRGAGEARVKLIQAFGTQKGCPLQHVSSGHAA